MKMLFLLRMRHPCCTLLHVSDYVSDDPYLYIPIPVRIRCCSLYTAAAADGDARASVESVLSHLCLK